MKRRNAFTLIELLAVIVILAIIALIATPIILGIIDDTKKDAFQRSVELVLSTTDLDISNKLYEDEYTYEVVDGNINDLEIEIKNMEGFNGTITYDSEGNGEYAIHNGVYCAIKTKEKEKVEVKEYVEGNCRLLPVLTESDITFITFNDLESVYDGTEKKLEVNNLSERFHVTYTNNKEINVGTYKATAIITGDDYRGSIKKEATLTIKKASITVKAEDKTSASGEDLVELTYQITSGAVYNNDDLNVVLTKEDGEEEGTYSIIVNAENPNYEIELVNGLYTITVGFTSEKCFAFSNGTITNYYDYQENDSSKKECPRDVRIPGTINDVVVTSIGSSAFKEKNITSVEIPSSVTLINNYAFRNNKLSGELDLSHLTGLLTIGYGSFGGKYDGSTNQITNIKFPSSVTSIGQGAFQDNKLTGELDLSHMTGLKTISSNTFDGESNGSTNQLTSVKLPSSVTYIDEYAFAYNKLSGELDLRYLTGLTSIDDHAFKGSKDGNITNQLTSVKLPSSVTSIGQYAFAYNKLSGELDLSYLTVLKTISSYAFYGEDSTNQLTSVKFPSSVTLIDSYAFAYNKLSGELDLSHLTGLTTIASSAFDGGYGQNTNEITSIKLPSSVTKIGERAFAYNKLSGELDLSHLTGLTTISASAFTGSTDGSTNQITNVIIPEGVTSIGNSAFSNNKLSGELDLSHLTGLTSIGSNAFNGNSAGSTNQITSLKLPNSVTSIGGSAFAYNKLSDELDLSYLINLTSVAGFDYNFVTAIKLPNSVTSIGGSSFAYNKLSGELDLSYLTGLTSIGGLAFAGKDDGSTNQITSLNLPSSVTSIGNSAFSNNKLSGELDLSHLTGLTTIGSSAFVGKNDGSTNQITSLNLPSSVTSIGDNAFAYNKLSGELDLSTLTGLTSIGTNTFLGTSKGSTNQIENVKFPNSIKKIGDSAFLYNKLSGELDLSTLTSLTTISHSAFQYNQIVSLKLPSSVTSIGQYSFAYNKLSGELDLSHLTGLTNIGIRTFEGSSDGSLNQITSLKLPSSVTSIGSYAFQYNKLSGELDLSHLTGLTKIETSSFQGDSNGNTNQITSLKLPSSLTNIGGSAFRYNALTSVTFYGRSGLTGVTVGSFAWGWATDHSDDDIHFEPTTE